MTNLNNRFLSVMAFIALVCFLLGFAAAKTLEDTKWIGNLVKGVQEKEVDPSIISTQNGLLPKVDGDIIIGLRKDGVVVWKRAKDPSNEE